MTQAGRVHTKFSFGMHTGYATPAHRAEIADHGALPRLHRASFAPFRLTAVEIEVEEELVFVQE
jgi:ribonuclease HII